MKRKYERTNEISGNVIDREIPALALHDGVVINADLSLGLAFKLECDYTPLLSHGAIEDMHNQMRGALNTLPEHFDIQVIWRQHRRTAEFKELLAKETTSPGVVGDVQEESRKMFLDMFNRGGLRFIEVYFVLVRRCTIPRKELAQRSAQYFQKNGESFLHKLQRVVLGPFTDHHILFQYQQREYMEALTELRTHAENMRRTFNDLGWEPRRLKNDEVISLFYGRWNRRRFEANVQPPKYRPADAVPLSEYFAHSPIEWTEKRKKDIAAGTLKVDGLLHRVVTLGMPGPQLAFPYFGDLLLHSGVTNVECVVNITRGSRIARIKELRLKLKQRKGAQQKEEDPVEREQLIQLDQELQELGANREHIWRASVFFILWAEDADALSKDVLALTTEASKMEAVLIEETHAAWAYWRASQPFWTQDSDRYRMLEYSTRQLACLLPLTGHPTNISPEKKLGILYVTSAGTPFNWLLPDGKLFTNPHHIIVGDTGAGKSMFECEKQAGLKRIGARSILIDLGGSYRNFCETLGGVYIDYNLDSTANRINPFYVDPEVEITPEMLRSRTLWLEQLVRDRGAQVGVDDIDLLEEAVQGAYARKHTKKQEVFLRDVREILSTHPKQRANVLASRLGSWCAEGGGSKGNLFDGPSQVNFSSPVIVFDLKRVARDNKDPDLVRIIFNSIMALIASLTSKRSEFPTNLSFDEAGEIVKDETNAKFLEYCYRTLRKNGVVVAAMTQDIDDFVTVNPDLANIIVGSVENRVIMKQNNAGKVQRLTEVLGLNAAERATVASIKTVPGEYSEFLLMQNTAKKRRSFRLLSPASPLRYAFSNNTSDDLLVVERAMQAGMKRADAIRAFAKKYPLGVGGTPGAKPPFTIL